MSARPYRYQLPQKAIKSDCPACGPKYRKTLSRYVDAQSGNPLPDIYGRCDRESNCGYYHSPYHKEASGMSYADVEYQRWKEGNHRTVNSHQYSLTSSTYARPRLNQGSSYIEEVKPICSIPDEVLTRSPGHYKQNQFARLLERRFGLAVSNELLNRFQIGTSKCWNSARACVFWLIDEQGRKRGGQVKLFDDSFHTVKYTDRNGRNRTRTSWVHSALAYQYEHRQQSMPEWLTNYIEQAEFSPCLFGLPQLLTEDTNKPIAIVEAPKTAVLCTPYFPKFIWLAVVARSYLNAERLAPLKGRSIILFPDVAKGGRDFEYWKTKAEGLRQQGFQIIVSDYLEQIATDEDREKGVDLADYLLKIDTPILPYITLESGRKIFGETLTVEPCDTYPPDWDAPNAPDAVPIIKQIDFFEWQRRPPYFSRMGLASLQKS